MDFATRQGGRALALAALLALAACDATGTTATGEADVSPASAAPAAGSASGSSADTTPATATAADTATSAGATPASGPPSQGGSVTAVVEARTIKDLNTAEEATPTSVDTAAAVFDKPNDGDIESALGADHWTFTGEAGQLLGIEIIEIGADCSQDLTLVLRDPAGTRAQIDWVGNGGCSVHGAFLLETTGEYALEFLGGDGSVIKDTTGTYRFVPYWLTDIDEAPISPGAITTGSIDQPLGADRWTFTAEAGSLLTVDIDSIGAECSQDLNMNLVNPFGERQVLDWVGNGGCSVQGPYELERAGEYVLEFRGGDGAVIEDNLGDYTFAIALA